MPETVEELKAKGMKLAVCSNKPHIAARKVVKAMYGDIFDEVMGQQEGIRRKPAPERPFKDCGKFRGKTRRMYVHRGHQDRYEDR